MVSSQLIVIGSSVRIASILSKTLNAGQFANAVTYFNATGEAFLHSFGVVSVQRSSRFGKNLVGACTHRIDHVLILIEIQRRFNFTRLLFVFKDGDQFDRSLTNRFEL